MIDTIQLLSREAAQKPWWDQYWRLQDSLNETMEILRSLGVKEFPNERKIGVSETGEDRTTPRAKPIRSASSTFGLSAAIRDAAKALGKGITRDLIEERISQSYPGQEINPRSLSALVSQISKEDGWVLISKGEGGRQSIYDLPDLSA